MINTTLEKIVSGGQTGVDRAALDIAIALGIPHGGWCPRGRKAEDGVISDKYRLIETDSADYSERTRLNIQDSDATLILVPAMPILVNDGTILTINEVKARKKIFMIFAISPEEENDSNGILDWINVNNIKILNIAGPRASQSNGIYDSSVKFLRAMFASYQLNTCNDHEYRL